MTEPSLPSTLPKRTATNRVALCCERLWRIISQTRFETPMMLAGFTALSLEMSTNLPTPLRSASCTRLRVPTMLLSTASRGFASSTGTCLCAAACSTSVGRKRWNAASRPSRSRMSQTTGCTGSPGRWAISSWCTK